ncbi:hypothetical protein E2562_015611 [Oryza meyeriana var. granulata]|uniref:Cathepsin propeptide inhibitor domain-containing protein n=1 Tax=Oryza meyeriana var. granulata TaxID=110450 RepID=A0A6G1EKT3_9ORYZ|nr:hypothetical protein E2562_015611 [Oryza meyeriana var. granulata]KAF0925197.1 hypothetical protein E2562_015611 [Oryza meyeriana var. granulata]
MARFHRLSLVVPVTLLLVFAGLIVISATAMAADPSDEDEEPIRIRMRYANEEESRWLDGWAEKYQSRGSGGGGFAVRRATDEESARLNRMRSDADKMARGGSGFGFDGRIEFDGDHPYGRVVVTEFPSSSKLNDDL